MIAQDKLSCFKAYDVRGKLGEELNNQIAYRIGRAAAQSLKAKTVALGFDARETSPSLAQAVANGVCDAGADVLEIGFSGTEEIYAAVCNFNADAGIEVTASHNPIDYNGMKIVKKGSQPLTEKEFNNIKNIAEKNIFTTSDRPGLITEVKEEAREFYVQKILSFVDFQNLKPLRIVINSGNGVAGPTIDALSLKFLKMNIVTDIVYINHDIDPTFPNGIPNPMLEENRSLTTDAIIKENADLGVAFDGDFDRCFLFDNLGNFIPGEYVIGLLAEVFLQREEEATIVHDQRAIWNTTNIVRKYNGNSIVSKTGHSFVKAKMRDADAVYGGEISAHHYFRDFAYCDSGMIPWLMVWELLSKKNSPFSNLISERKVLFPSSGELNFKVSNTENCINLIKNLFSAEATSEDELDGLSMVFKNWRFNLRQSNTEPLVRLNVETKGDLELLKEKTEVMKKLIKYA